MKKQDIQKILKKIEKQTQQQKIKQTNKIRNNEYSLRAILNKTLLKMNKSQLKIRQYIRKQFYNNQNKYFIFITIFLCITSSICWKMQKKYDLMRNEIYKTQTHRKKLLEEQNEYINEMLNRTQFKSIAIKDEIPQKQRYYYEQNNFDTRDELLQRIKLQKQGSQLTPEEQDDLKKNNII